MSKHKCAECGEEEGNLHLAGCDIERCLRCKGQLLSCGCLFPNDEDRILVLESVDEDFGNG